MYSYSYRDSITGMVEAMNSKRTKYIRQQRLSEKKRDNVIDLTGNANNSNNNQEQYIDGPGDDITVTYFKSDGSRARTFMSQVDVQTEVSKQSNHSYQAIAAITIVPYS